MSEFGRFMAGADITAGEWVTIDHRTGMLTPLREAEKFPFTTPAGSDARMFIQWKGTRVCLDFWCACGADGHLDGDFAYYVKCPACGQVYEMGTQVIARKVDGDDYPSTQVLAVDDAPSSATPQSP